MIHIDTWHNQLYIDRRNNRRFAKIKRKNDAVIVFDVIDYYKKSFDIRGQEITLYNEKHSQTKNITVTDKNILTVKLDPEFLEEEGIVELQFNFKDAEGEMFCPAFYIEVEKNMFLKEVI